MPDSDPLYPHYKKARNRIRKCEPLSMVEHLIECLRKAHAGGVQVIRTHQPWHILLALKWTFQEMDGLCYRRPRAEFDDARRVLHIMHEADDGVLSNFSHVTLFVRQKAFQQFWIYPDPDGSALARQEILFGGLAANHGFARQFLGLTGVPIAEYLELTFGLMALVLSEENCRFVDRGNFSNLEPKMEAKKIESFLAHLSRTPNQLHAWFDKPAIRNVAIADQFGLPSPLTNAPFLRIGERLHIYYLPQVYRALEQAIYRPLRTIDPAEFGRIFGPMFEAYVANVMTDANVTFTNETELKGRLPGTGKVVDFLVLEDDCNILIDAKGVEMSAAGRTATTARQLYSTVKNSAMKAVAQGMETLGRIRQAPSVHTWGKLETYLIVVTFESLYLGSSSDVGTTFDDSLGADLKKQFGLPYPFPLENVFFLNIREFEDLLGRVRAKETSILKMLRIAKEADADPKTRKLDFKLHLMAHGNAPERLPFIEAGLDRLQNRCINRLKPS